MLTDLPEACRWLTPEQGTELWPGSSQSHVSLACAHGPRECRSVCRAGLDPLPGQLYPPGQEETPSLLDVRTSWGLSDSHLCGQ